MNILKLGLLSFIHSLHPQRGGSAGFVALDGRGDVEQPSMLPHIASPLKQLQIEHSCCGFSQVSKGWNDIRSSFPYYGWKDACRRNMWDDLQRDTEFL